ncbi:MAG: hypothetical protein R3D89_13755 [Sphingomonadaceae bacterium]
MSRFLLTCLALLTGLSLAGTSAEARAERGFGVEVGQTLGEYEAVDLRAQMAETAGIARQATDREDIGTALTVPLHATAHSVFTGIDRARE